MSLLISIIIPTFNSEKYIKECIESVIKQTYSNWELIIVDDGSCDNTIEIVSTFEHNHENIHLIKRTSLPKGANKCRNIGIYNSKGIYLIFLDSDDYLEPFCLSQRVDNVLKYSTLNIAIFKTKLLNMESGELKIKSELKISDPIPYIISLKHVWQTTAPIWKKKFIVKIGMFNEKYERLQNIELDFRAISNNNVKYKLFSNQKADYVHREYHKELGTNFWKKATISVEFFINDLIPFLKKNSEYKKFFRRTIWNYTQYSYNANLIPNGSLLNQLFSVRAINKIDYKLIRAIISLSKFQQSQISKSIFINLIKAIKTIRTSYYLKFSN